MRSILITAEVLALVSLVACTSSTTTFNGRDKNTSTVTTATSGTNAAAPGPFKITAPSSKVGTATPTVTWTASPGAVTYNLNSGTANQGGAVGPSVAKTVYSIDVAPPAVNDNHRHFLVNDRGNTRVLVYDSMPLDGSAMPSVVIGQLDFVSAVANSPSGLPPK